MRDHFHFFDEATGQLTDVDADKIAVQGPPPFPASTEITGMDVIVRIRPKRGRLWALSGGPLNSALSRVPTTLPIQLQFREGPTPDVRENPGYDRVADRPDTGRGTPISFFWTMGPIFL